MEFDERPGYLIRRAQQMAVAIFNEECAEAGLTPVQYAALVAMRAQGPLDATRLAALIWVDRSTIGSVLDRLEAKNLIVRMPDPADRRLKILRLTAPGEAMLQRVAPAVETAQARILERLNPGERATLLALLRKLISRADAAKVLPEQHRINVTVDEV